MPPTLKELAIKYLVEKIAEGAYPPGTKLSDFALSKEIGISRTPIREALNQLAAEGVLEIHPRAGAFVKVVSHREVEELYEIREILESHAAAKAASEPGTELLKSLRDIQKKMAELPLNSDPLDKDTTRASRDLDLEFHQQLIHAAGNGRLEKILDDSRLLARLFMIKDERMTIEEFNAARGFHDQLLAAIESEDSEKAEDVMRRHVRRALANALAIARKKDSQAENSIPETLRKFL